MTSRWLASIGLALAWMALGAAAAAQSLPFTNIAGLRSLPRSALAQRPAARLAGVVTARETAGDWYLQSEGTGIRFADSPAAAPLVPGARVEIEGVADADDRGIVLQPSRIAPRGIGSLPEPVPCSLASAADPRTHGLRVTVEGTVVATSPIRSRSSNDPPEMFVVLGSPDATLALRVQGRSHDDDTPALRGSRIRATGVVQPIASPQGQVLAVMLLVTPGTPLLQDPDARASSTNAPLVPIRSPLRAAPDASADQPVRIQGVVTAVLSPFSAFVEDETAGILVRSLHALADATPGDLLTAEGFPRIENTPSIAGGLDVSTVTFEAYAIRSNGRRALPTALDVAHDALQKAPLNFRRVTVEGLVQAVARQESSRDFRISLRCGDTAMDVLGHDSVPASPLPAAQARVRVTGVLDQRAQRDTHYQALRLHVAQARDVVEIAPPPREWTRELATAAALGTALGLAALAWAFALRRGVRRRTAELATANASLALANRARADFLAHMSHEVRNPVHAMNGLLQLLARHPLPGEPRALVQRLATASRSLTHLVNDALDLSKIDAGQLVLDPQPFHPNELLDHLDGLFAPLAHDKGLAWSVQRLPAHAPRLVGDAHRLQQILSNLASNAIKFTRHGHVRLLASLAPASPTDPNGPQALSITCEDSGTGIAPETLQRLFQPYSQADASIPRTHGGTGLGLAIARRLAGVMGGSLHAESQPDAGSRFHLVVSLAVHAGDPAQDPPAQAPSPGLLPHGQRLEGRRILVADDHPTNLGILEAAIELEQGCAWLVPDGLAALRAFESDPAGFDAVVMDLEMPVMDGIEAIRCIRAIPRTPAVPILACSAGIRAAQRAAALAAGATGFLSKPFDLRDLVAALAQHLPAQPQEGPGTPTPPPHPPQPTPTDTTRASPVAFPSIHGIDNIDAAQRFDGNHLAFLRALGRFSTGFEGFAAALRQDVGLGQRKAAIDRLHGLAGTAAMIGAREVATLAHTLEALLRHPPTGPLPPWDAFSPLAEALDRLLASIASHVARSETCGHGPTTREPTGAPATHAPPQRE